MYLGDYTTANSVFVYFNTFDSNDPSASVTLTGLALGDIQIYKNGSTTQRSSTAGIALLDTDGIDFDGLTGIHGFSIDLSDNTDAGFYAAGGEYTVVVASVTVDAATVNFVAAQFSIERTGGALALLKGTNSLADIESKIDTLTTNVATVDTVVDGIVTTLGTPAGASVSADIAAIEAQTDDIGAAGAGLTAVPWNPAWDAEVESEVTDALTAYDPPTKAEMDTAFGDVPTATENADALLNRDMSAVSDTNARSPLNALRLLRNKWTSAAGTLTVTKEDDTTSAWTSVLSGDASADPVVGSDPA
jgi:hypothetical protein